jgi:hypothetical protein
MHAPRALYSSGVGCEGYEAAVAHGGTLRALQLAKENVMTKRIARMFTAAALLTNFALLGLSACAHEGPAQKAGRHLDNAADDVKDDLKK